MKKVLFLFTFLFSIFIGLAQQEVTLISPSPSDGATLESPPTFRFRTTRNGCYVFVITSSSAQCSANTGVWNSSLEPMYAGGEYSISVPQSVWNSLQDGNTYWWHVSYRVVNCPELPLPLYSECRRFTKAGCSVPTSSPTPSSPCGGELVSESRPTLSWGPNGTNNYGVYYHIQVSENSSFTLIVAETADLTYNNTSWRITTALRDNTTYYWRVRAEKCNPRSYGPWSSTCSFKVSLPLEAPNNLQVTRVDTTARTVELTWNSVSGDGIKYNVLRRSEFEQDYVEIARNLLSNTYVDRGLEYNTTYSYVVVATKNSQISGYSNTVSIRLFERVVPQKKCYYYPNNTNPTLKFCGDYIGVKENTIRFTNSVSVNEVLWLEGNVEIDTLKCTLSLNGSIYIENVKLPGGNSIGRVTLYEGEYTCSFLDRNFISDKQINEFKKANYFSGIKLIPKKIELVGDTGSIGVRIAAEIWIENTKNCNDKRRRTRFEIQNLEIIKNIQSNVYEISFEGGINGLGFGFRQVDNSIFDICLSELLVKFKTSENLIDFDGKFLFKPFNKKDKIEFTFGVGYIDECFNKAKIGLKVNKPIPLGNLPIGISGFGGEVDGLCSGQMMLKFWGATRPIIYPDLFELELSAALYYGDEFFADNRINFTAQGNFWKFNSSDDWCGNGFVSGDWFFNKDKIKLKGGVNFIKYRDEDDNDNYIVKGEADVDIYLK
ncbi:MAG: fibronectin type III domain-containing protein, partial [Candidatus Kapaibacteriota bacterium]